MKSTRTHGERISPSQRRKYAEALRAFWSANPDATIVQAREATNAPYNYTQTMRVRLVREGILKPHQHAKRKTSFVDLLPEPMGRVAQRRADKSVRDSIEGGFASPEDFT